MNRRNEEEKLKGRKWKGERKMGLSFALSRHIGGAGEPDVEFSGELSVVMVSGTFSL